MFFHKREWIETVRAALAARGEENALRAFLSTEDPVAACQAAIVRSHVGAAFPAPYGGEFRMTRRGRVRYSDRGATRTSAWLSNATRRYRADPDAEGTLLSVRRWTEDAHARGVLPRYVDSVMVAIAEVDLRAAEHWIRAAEDELRDRE